MTFSRADSNFSAKSQETRTPFIFVISNPLKCVNGRGQPPGKMGTCSPNLRAAVHALRTQSSESDHVRRRRSRGYTHTLRTGTHTHSLTCCAALSASSANSTDRPFSACFRDPHVLLCRVAQEGSGVVSDPKALRKMERPTQGLEDDQRPN